jgi:hypothetical protein
VVCWRTNLHFEEIRQAPLDSETAVNLQAPDEIVFESSGHLPGTLRQFASQAIIARTKGSYAGTCEECAAGQGWKCRLDQIVNGGVNDLWIISYHAESR